MKSNRCAIRAKHVLLMEAFCFPELFLSCLAVILMGALYEGYKEMREIILRRTSRKFVLPQTTTETSDKNGMTMQQETVSTGSYV